jgi:hypothetical protein
MTKKSKAEKSGAKMAKEIEKHAENDAKLAKKSAKRFAKEETRAVHNLKNGNTFSV